YDKIMALGVDSNDNIVVGGHFGSSLLDSHPAGTLFKAGGNTDFFVAQYGSGNCNTLSIHEPAAPLNIKLYPQPARERLHLHSDIPLNNYIIYSLQGQRMQSGAVQDNQLDTSQLSPGVYILQITDNEQRKQSFKLVVE
ncbi:MAG: T9SS type A sorting domain-containing protein, partial [Flavobacteriaceae bacterium]|nr:T9SS type A sorting domain-containing protein [Flavobacteriaceae bacterium]